MKNLEEFWKTVGSKSSKKLKDHTLATQIPRRDPSTDNRFRMDAIAETLFELINAKKKGKKDDKQ